MPTLDEQIAQHLAEALKSGELKAAPSFGKPLAEREGWDETPEELRQAFKILKDAGFAPPEIALFHERAQLRAQVDGAATPSERQALQRMLSELEQKIALRLESLRARRSL
ncbi:DnaJ family domain-containing protein [Ramlibacter sp. PS4R-6]|uniref:DnaJ family domain-containing protein n=1 Tax=Ramlibacter sp. PS4R-6 TaxID=3133438 RepID=UPI00309870A5